MREKFKEYYTPTDEEFEDLWNNCIFVFDTNVLLKLYRYSEETREQFFKVFEEVSDRIWLPYQVGLEYQNNRIDKIKESVKIYEEVHEKMDDILGDLNNFTNKINIHPKIDMDEIKSKIVDAVTEIKEDVDEKKEKHPDLLEKDFIKSKLNKYFKGKVGDDFSDKELDKICKEGKERYEKKIPPGYKDKHKEGSGKHNRKKYGDFIIWKEILQKAKEEEKNIIFITDDEKEDWWWIEEGRKHGPRPELRKEMRKKAGVSFYMYRSKQFIEYAEDYLEIPTKKRVIKEIEEVEKDELMSSRRKVILKTIYEKFGTESTFSKDQLNNLLETDTTLGLLDELWEDGYLEVINRGGTPMLLALIPNEDNQREFAAEDQEELANDMVDREDLDLDAEDYNWVDNEERYEFCETFNELAKEKHEEDDKEPIQFNATFTRNIYKLTEEGAEVIEENIQDK